MTENLFDSVFLWKGKYLSYAAHHNTKARKQAHRTVSTITCKHMCSAPHFSTLRWWRYDESHAIPKASETLDLRTAQTRRDPSSKKARAESNIPTPPHFAGSWWAGKAKCSHKALPAGSTPTLLHLQALQAEPHACNTQTCNMSDTCTGTDMRKTKHQLRTYFPLRYTHACTSQLF